MDSAAINNPPEGVEERRSDSALQLTDVQTVLRSLFDSWSEKAPAGPIERSLVHKSRDQNVALSRVSPVRGHVYAAQVHVDLEHPFFFDHPVDHVPGLLLIEAARQFGIVVAHQFYGAGSGDIFSLTGVECDFGRYAELEHPTFIRGEVTPIKTVKGVARELRFEGHFVQRNQPVGAMCGKWRILAPATWERIRRFASG
jgi:2-oxo-3-(phosphooxy)propyl 3-oxoalkanoate synthase